MVTGVLDSVSYDDMAAYTVAFAVTAVTLSALWLLGRCTLRTCAIWALCLLPVLAVACGEPNPDPDKRADFDNCDPTCEPSNSGELGNG